MSITDESAHELLRQGKLEEALSRLKADVQTEPANGKHRIFLFQLLSVFGRWESALKQLQIAGDLDPSALGMVQDYREAIRCEEQRERIFTGKDSPTILGEPDSWVAWLIEALKLEASGQHGQADALRSRAMEEAPATSGTITLANDTTSEFAWIADADPRMGPTLEAILNEQYYWIPLNQIAQIDFEAPSDLRDFVWTAAHFTLVNGTQTIGMIPTRYFGSESENDASLRLARKSDWRTIGDSGTQLGIGQRMFATDLDDYALLELRKLSLHVDVQQRDDAVTEQSQLLSTAAVDLVSKLSPAEEG